jgi:hypothetical protein
VKQPARAVTEERPEESAAHETEAESRTIARTIEAVSATVAARSKAWLEWTGARVGRKAR